jgi:Uma2 family endonuclease
MARSAPSRLEKEERTIPVPGSVRFPVELVPPEGFDPARIETWPEVEGSLEWVAGRLLYMPPCGALQQFTVAELVAELVNWARSHVDFVVGTNEAGVHLGSDTRGADGAVFRRADVGAPGGGFQTVPPVLAAEVTGRYEHERELRDKARWYLDAGVAVVWVLLPSSREVLVVTRAGESRHRIGERIPAHPQLSGLAPQVDDLFRQVSAAR